MTALVIQPNVPVPQKGHIKKMALAMEIGDMIECPPLGKTPSNNYTSRIHRILVENGRKARSSRIVKGSGKAKKVVIQTWRIA